MLVQCSEFNSGQRIALYKKKIVIIISTVLTRFVTYDLAEAIFGSSKILRSLAKGGNIVQHIERANIQVYAFILFLFFL